MKRRLETRLDSVRRSARRGFTLAELLVAIALVALLTVGIGQVFKHVSNLVQTGHAVAEVDQAARAIEQQLRDDFRAASRMSSEETFLAIRSRRVGDVQLDGIYNSNRPDRALYIRREDQDADVRAGVAPYAEGSRAVTVRCDEIMFLAMAGDTGQYDSFQEWDDEPVSAMVARIYYGHGLRPAPDPDYDPDDPTTAPRRTFLPDGEFGQAPGEANRFDPSRTVTGRNQYAGDFILCRHALLLYGGAAAGYANGRESPIGNDREYAMYIRDLETELRLFLQVGLADQDEMGGPTPDEFPDPRLIRHGRTDICAQGLEEVKQWLEGSDWCGGTGTVGDATAFNAGRLDPAPEFGATDPCFPSVAQNFFDRRLWMRRSVLEPGAPNPLTVQGENLRGLRSAIAGCFFRMLCESEPPLIVRDVSMLEGDPKPDPEDALMDLQGTLGAHCSSFEVAWSDGSTWLDKSRDLEVDLDGDNNPDVTYTFGDIIWFDFDFTRRRLSAIDPRNYPLPFPDAEVLGRTHTGGDLPQPERTTRLLPASQAGGYTETAGAMRGFSTSAAQNGNDEYLAIWGFRVPDQSGGYGGAWAKPRMIRIRATLHDSQFRLRGGKTFEFILSLTTQ